MVNPAAVKVTPREIAVLFIKKTLEDNPDDPAVADLPDLGQQILAWSKTPRLDLMDAVVELAKERLAGVTPAGRPAGEALEFLTRAPEIVNTLHARGDDELRAPLSALADLQITMLQPFSAVDKWSEEHLVVIEAGFRMLNELLELNTNWCTDTFSDQLNTLAGAFLNSPALTSLLNSQQELNGAEAVHELVRAMDGLCVEEILENLAHVAGLINRKCLFHLGQDKDVYDAEELTDEDDYEEEYYGDSSEPASSSFDKEDEEAIYAALDCWDETTRRILCKLTDSTAVSAATIGQIESIFNESLRSTLLQLEALDVIAVHAPEKLSTLLHNMLQKMGDDHAPVSPYYTLRALLRLGIIQQRYPGNTKLKDPTDIIVDEICRYCTGFSSTKEAQMEAFDAVFKPTTRIFLNLAQTTDAPFREQLMEKFSAIYDDAKNKLTSSPKNKNPRGT